MDLLQLLAKARKDGEVAAITESRRVSFGTPTRRRIFLEMLPPALVDANMYREEDIRFKSIIAVPSERYSPPMLVEGERVASMKVELGESSIARELKAQVFDAITRLLNTGRDMEAMTRYLDWLRLTRDGLDDLNELQAVQAVIFGAVNLRGANGLTEVVPYLDPAGHRIDASAQQWSDPTTDPLEQLYAAHQVGVDAGKGNAVRAITTQKTINMLLRHPKTLGKFGRFTIGSGGALNATAGARVQLADLNAYMAADGLPALEPCDLQYGTQTTRQRFMPEGSLVLQFDTGRDPNLDLGDEGIIQLPNSPAGYTGIGIPAGRVTPGVVLLERPKLDEHPPRVEVDGVQTSAPVIQDPEAFVAIRGIS